jgi:hypothetical protein
MRSRKYTKALVLLPMVLAIFSACENPLDPGILWCDEHNNCADFPTTICSEHNTCICPKDNYIFCLEFQECVPLDVCHPPPPCNPTDAGAPESG